MRKSDLPLAKKISEKLTSFEDINDLPGIVSKASRECLLEQMVDSCRRIKYVTTIAAMNMDQSVTDPTKKTFDPLKAAVWFKQNGNIEEAFWLTFLATHFGKNKKIRMGIAA
ncbi:MAG: hypothetical protein IPL54_16980 [Chitinophagaceae bacterium]|nr:hypothetical protein [Chitinophagaceae bacterium]